MTSSWTGSSPNSASANREDRSGARNQGLTLIRRSEYRELPGDMQRDQGVMNVIEEAAFTDRLIERTAAEGLLLSRHQAQICWQHLRLMLEWNLRLNLTRITDPEEILVKHFLDSMIPARFLPQAGLALDVGTGPGFPGIPLKVLQPDLSMVLLESARKKVSFLRVLLSQIPCDNIWAVQGRWEEFPRMDHPLSSRHYKLVTMRAVRLQPEHLRCLAAPILEPGGVFAWWAGPGVEIDPQELSRLIKGTGLEFDGDYSYSLSSASRPRRLLTWKKIS